MLYDTVEQRVISNQYGVCRPRILRCCTAAKQTREREEGREGGRDAHGEERTLAARMHRADLEGNVMHSVAIIAR